MNSENHRSYGPDESVLICEMGTYKYVSDVFDALTINYFKTIEEEITTETKGWFGRKIETRTRNIVKKYHSLQSALTDGCDSLHIGDKINFDGKPHLQKLNKPFILPLLIHTESHNIVPDTVYFHCISGVKGATIGIVSPENQVVTVYCPYDVLIFHSTKANVQFIKANRSAKEEWEYLISTSYRHVKAMEEDLPFLKETEQTRIRDSVVEDVIQYNIPTVIEGVTSSGKTFTVEQYCMRAQLPLVRYNFSPSSTTEELLGDVVITDDVTERIKFKDGAFTDAFIHGKVLLMDEMSLAPPSVIQSVLSYLFGKKILHEGKEGNEECDMHRDFRIIATQNPAGSSYKRSNLSSSIRDCFRFITHDAKQQKYFPRIDSNERLQIIAALFGDNRIGEQVSLIHEKADNRKNVSGREIDKGKDYTLRDCTRTKWLLRVLRNQKISEDNALNRSLQIAYNENLGTNPVFKHKITFGKAPLDKKCWSDVYDRVYSGLKAGCHILLIGETEYVARKYCRAIMEILEKENVSSEVIHCSSTSSTENVIGTYALQKENGNPIPLFCPSPLLTAIENGGICILQSMHTMKSNVIERLNSVLELSPADGHRHVVRFDERRENPDFVMSPEFRVIATTSEKGLLAFSPALRNRFLEVFVGQEDEKQFEMRPKIEQEEEEDEIDDYIDSKYDCFKRQTLHRMVYFASNMSHYELDHSLVQLISEEDMIRELQPINNQCEEISKLFYSICRNKATALCGPKMSGKTYAVGQLLKQMDIKKYQIFSVSGETEFSTLMGSTDIKGDFNPGRLLQAVEGGELVIFENAENMSAELLEMLDVVLDPFTHEFYYPANEGHTIHPLFRALFIFTTRRVTTTVSLPAYFEICTLKPIDGKRAKDMMTSEICKRLCDHVSTGEIPLNEVFTIDKVCFNNPHPVWRVAGLFADRLDRKELLEKIIEKWKNDSPAMKEELEHARVILSTPSATLGKTSDSNKSSLQRGGLEIHVPIPYDDLKDVDSSILTAVFTTAISSYKQAHLPVLLVGDSDITSEVSRLLLPSALRLELSRSMEMSHTFGEVSVCRKEDIQYILRQTSEGIIENSPMEAYREYLKRQLQELNEDDSLLMMRPGPVLRSVMSNNSLVLNNVNLLNDRLLPRLYALLFNLDSDHFSLFEDYIQLNREVVGNRVNAFVTCESPDFGRVEKRDQFIQVFCQPFSALEKEKYRFDHRNDYPLHILRKSSLLMDEFKLPEKVIPFYLTYLQSDSASRVDLIRRSSEDSDEMKKLNQFLQSSNRDNAMIEDKDMNSLSFLFSDDVITCIRNSLHSKHYLLPTKTTVQLLASIVLADKSHIPLILEGDPGVGKTVAAENYFTEQNLEFKRINFSNSITIDSLFGCYTLVNGSLQFKNGSITDLLVNGPSGSKRIALLLDEVNLAPCDVLEVILNLLRCYANHERFQVPGGDLIDIPEDMLIVCCMNPAAMSANRSTLPRQFYKYCIYHRDLKYTLNELFLTARQILSNVVDTTDESIENQILDLFTYSYNSYQKTSIPFSLRDVLKVDQIIESGNDLTLSAALWLVFACRYEESERREIEKILKQEDELKVEIDKQDDHCVVRGYWEIVTKNMYSGLFREWCFTSTEKVTVFKMSLALQSKRAILVYGASPSGKSYTISNIALMWDKQCKSVFLNHESSPDVFIGRSTLGMDDNGNECITFRKGPLLEAMENGKLVIFENAENMSSELLEELDSILDPLTNQYSGVIKSCSIHPLFRVLFVVSETSPSSLSFPSYVQCVRMNALTVDFITSHIDTFSSQSNGRELIRRLCTHVPSRISLQEIMMLSVLFYSTDPFKVIVGLYADREDRRDLILDVIRDWRENDSSLQSELDHVVNSIQTSAVTVKKCGNTDGSEITRGNYNTILSVPYSTLENVDPSVLRCLFSIGTSGWKRAESPILLIGDSDVISEVTQLLFPKSVRRQEPPPYSHFSTTKPSACSPTRLMPA